MPIFGRIPNPYMPQGTSNLTNSQVPAYAPGELGAPFFEQDTGQVCLRVVLDSGATSATPTGAVAQGQLAFWKNQSQALVTNDQRFCDVGPAGAANRVAGVFQLAVSTAPGTTNSYGQPVQYYCDLVVQKVGGALLCSTTPAAGQLATANTTAGTANAIANAIGTAPPTQTLGTWASATAISGSLFPCDINIGFVD
jgi:hypothetical protein